MELQTARLRVVNANEAMLLAELSDPTALEPLLGATLPSQWPPDLFERDDMQRCLAQARSPEPNWGMWYIVIARGDGQRVAGIVGLNGPPTTGTVQLGYSVSPEYQRRGVATEATRALVEWAFADPRTTSVTAETFPSLVASRRVLEKCGFHEDGIAETKGAIRYSVTRSA